MLAFAFQSRFDQVVKDYDTVSDDFDRLKSVATTQLQNAGELYSEVCSKNFFNLSAQRFVDKPLLSTLPLRY